MSLWYVAHPDELLLDLDAYDRKAADSTWGEIYFRRRLRNAIKAGVLPVKSIVLQSSSHRKGHRHALITLDRPLPQMERMIWQIHLGGDLYKGRADLMRAARGYPFASLLIRQTPFVGARDPDFQCPCSAKHITADRPDCPIWRRLRGATPWEMFGPTTKESREHAVELPVGEVPIELILRTSPVQPSNEENPK